MFNLFRGMEVTSLTIPQGPLKSGLSVNGASENTMVYINNNSRLPQYFQFPMTLIFLSC